MGAFRTRRHDISSPSVSGADLHPPAEQRPAPPPSPSVPPVSRPGFGGCGGGEMDDDANMSIKWRGFFESPAKLGLQLMSGDRDTKQLLSGSPFLHHQHQQHVPHHHHQPHHPRDCGANGNANGGAMPPPPATEAPPSMPMNFVRSDMWMHPQQQQQHHHPRQHNVLHNLTVGHGSAHIAHHDPVGYGMIPGTHTLQMMQQQTEPQPQPPPPPQQPKEECISSPLIEENVPVIDEPPPPKKRQQGRQPKVPRAKKPKKSAAPREDGAPPNAPAPRRRGPRKNIGMVINGIDLDLSRIPTPICSCTGAPQQCYRWGAGGWQSACCTTTISTYPLPMSTKRRGARIAGRKMSHGAFKKVLEKLAGEGYQRPFVLARAHHSSAIGGVQVVGNLRAAQPPSQRTHCQ
uniref:GAGA-binding transcriptional activator n=1 Tax=Oryza meridionalis TaxID=40149 RepID=A0A0E0EVB9_9ORYZ